jgi:2-polyprenyl-3-methyl-5-hydroxy-6-metoxy-1,4-benzoquinol methylase
MQWIDIGDTLSHRKYLIDFCKNKNYKVLDVGGGADSWAAEISTACIDYKVNPLNKTKINLQGDILSDVTWNYFVNQKFDIVILSHILEDVRDPFYLVRKAREVSENLFISVPHKSLEVRNIESMNFVGFHHHRWIFSSDGKKLFITPKTSLASSFSNYQNLLTRKLKILKAKNMKNSYFDTIHYWDKLNTNLKSPKNLNKYTSLSCIVSSESQIVSNDYIESGEQLLNTYKQILFEHKY